MERIAEIERLLKSGAILVSEDRIANVRAIFELNKSADYLLRAVKALLEISSERAETLYTPDPVTVESRRKEVERELEERMREAK